MNSKPPNPPDEFYIGYAPPMPPHIARYVKRAVMTIAAGVPIAASLIALGHVRLDGGTFEYGRPQTIAGVIAARPYPSIAIDRERWALLVAPGKHGAAALAAPFDGQRVTLEGTRIHRGGAMMFEVAPGSIATATPTAGAGGAPAPAKASGGDSETSREGDPVTLRGEIVDSKCFLGVMVPGDGKTHKDCASLCLRGGIPPAFSVRDRDGRSALLLLVSESGDSLAGHPAVARLAGEPIELTGVIDDRITPSETQGHGWRMLRTNPSEWRPLGTPAR